jgi:sugar O-acyltransferase (sialic acid O-acetyltransferase NeuD family)
MDEIILIGSGGHARSCIDVIEREGRFKIAGLIEKKGSATGKSLRYSIIGVDDDLKTLQQRYTYAFITIAQIKSPDLRIRLFNLLKTIQYQIPVIISPFSYVSEHVEVGEGTIIMHDAVVNSNVRLGDNCIINSKALVEHDSIIGNHCHIATGAIVNGEVRISEGTFIGSGAIIRQAIKIGNNCIIGAGCVVKRDVPDNKMVKN